MSMLPMYKKCPKCKRRYSYNPSVGEFSCPYCFGIGGIIKEAVDLALGERDGAREEDVDDEED